MIDEVPVGQGKKVQIDEYPPDFNPETLVTQEAQPLKNRLKSAVFRVRVQAYEEAMEQLDEVEIENLYAMIQDNNPQCLDKGLNVVQKYIMTKGPLHINALKDIIKNLIEKPYINLKMRPKVNQIFVHIFENGHKIIIFENIITMLGHKNPKVVQGSIALILELLQQFGAKRMDNLKPFFCSINKLIEGQQAGCKGDAVAFYKEVARWLGKSIELHWGTLNEKLKQELNAIVEGLPKDHAMKAIRCETVEAPPTDLYEMADPVDAFKPFTDAWCTDLLALEKWVEKKEKLDQLLKAVSQPKLLNHNNLYNIVQTLKRLIGDNIMAISNQAIKICGYIAQGMRRGFLQNAKILLQCIMMKLKDKKQQVVDETLECLKKFLYTITIDEMFENLVQLLEDKAPNTRVNVLQVLEMGIDENPKEKLQKLNNMKSIVILTKKQVEDGNADVRNKAIQLLAKISAKLYAGTLGVDLKGEKLSKYQSFLANYQSQYEDPKKQQSVMQPKPKPIQPVQQQEEVIIKQQVNLKEMEQLYQQQKQQYEDEEQAQKKNALQQKQKQQPQKPQQEVNQFEQNQSQNQQQSKILVQAQPTFPIQQSNIIKFQEELQQQEQQQEQQKQQNDSFKQLLGQFGQEQKQKQVEQKPKVPPQVALQQVLDLKAQLEQQQPRPTQQQLKFELSSQKPPILANQIDQESSEKYKSDDRMKALEQAKSMILLPTIQQAKASKVRNQENTQNLSNIFAGGNQFQEKPQVKEEEPQNNYPEQVQGYKNFRETKRGELRQQKKDLDKEKQKRLQEYERSGFICYSFCDHQWYLIKEQIMQVQLPQVLIDKMFGINNIQHIAGINMIKDKIKDVYPISDLLFKWGYMVSFMGESVPLQLSVQMLFMDIIDKLKQQDQKLTHMEARLMYLHSQMVCVLFASQVNEKLPNRVLPMLMTNLLAVKRMGYEAIDFLQQFPAEKQINLQASIIYNYITQSLEQYQDQPRQSAVITNILKQIQKELPKTPSKVIEQPEDLIRSANTQPEQRLYAEFLQKCEMIVRENFIYTNHDNVVNFIELTIAVGSSNLSPAQIRLFLDKIYAFIDRQNFIKNLQYYDFYALFDFLIQRTVILNEAVEKENEILRQFSSILLRLVYAVDIHFIYYALSEILIKTRNEGFLAKYKYISQIFVKISNKLIGLIYNKFVSARFPEILKKIEEFIELCQQNPSQQFADIDRLNFKTLQTTFNSLMTFGNTAQIQQLFNNTQTNSVFRGWYAEYTNKSKNIIGSSDQSLKSLANGLRLDFDRTFELFVAHLQKFQNPNWKSHVGFLTPQQIRYIEDRLQQDQRRDTE